MPSSSLENSMVYDSSQCGSSGNLNVMWRTLLGRVFLESPEMSNCKRAAETLGMALLAFSFWDSMVGVSEEAASKNAVVTIAVATRATAINKCSCRSQRNVAINTEER